MNDILIANNLNCLLIKYYFIPHSEHYLKDKYLFFAILEFFLYILGRKLQYRYHYIEFQFTYHGYHHYKFKMLPCMIYKTLCKYYYLRTHLKIYYFNFLTINYNLFIYYYF